MPAPKVLVVGGGVAGISAALAASRSGATVTLIEAAGTIGLSKALMPLLISEPSSEETLVAPEAKCLSELGVNVRKREAARAIRRKGGRIALESSGRSGEDYDSAVVCTGSSPEAPLLRGASKTNAFVLRGKEDYLSLSKAAGGLSRVAISGPVPLALRIAEALAAMGRQVDVYCGRGGLARQFPGPLADAIYQRASLSFQAERVRIMDSSIDSILGVEKVEAVESEGAVRVCDSVVLIPRSVPSVPSIDCVRGQNGGLLVDLSMSTSLPGVFAAGDAAEIKFKSGSVPARLHSTSTMGGEVAGINAAGGDAVARPSWSFEQSYFGLEFCSSGLSEEAAAALGLEAASATSCSPDEGSKDLGRNTIVCLVYDKATHQVYGVQALGWRASALSSAASLVVALGLTAEQLLHIESPYFPGAMQGASPISLTARKIPDVFSA